MASDSTSLEKAAVSKSQTACKERWRIIRTVVETWISCLTCKVGYNCLIMARICPKA